ncbi:MAG: hypothetical protein HWQ35_15585 [Nostoc sp. NMS1]|nr:MULTISPECIES: hypothetical protein [unclassified Nostoc]MBN3907920.1 hypothetical protein [Nostoc sp. NMS1]MBN3994044.1 hypothetical protein [Nostoc sp. NMS2]
MLAFTATESTQPIILNSVRVNQPTSKGLFAKWQKIDGKLTCNWLKNPD